MAVRHATPDAGSRGADPGGAQRAREPRDACPGGRDRAGGLGASGGMAPRCRRCFESGSGRAARAGTLGRAAGAARGGRHGRLAAGHARPGGARSARRAARRVAHRERAAVAARNDGRLGISRALGAPPRRVLLRPTPAGAVCVGAPLEPDRADEGLRRARELRSRGTRPPRLVGAGPHAAVRLVRARVDGARARPRARSRGTRSEEHTSELQSHSDLVCRLLLEKKKKQITKQIEKKKKTKNINTAYTANDQMISHKSDTTTQEERPRKYSTK